MPPKDPFVNILYQYLLDDGWDVVMWHPHAIAVRSHGASIALEVEDHMVGCSCAYATRSINLHHPESLEDISKSAEICVRKQSRNSDDCFPCRFREE